MLFEIDYQPDITYVFCHDWQTCTLIIRGEDGLLRNVDTWCDHRPSAPTDDPYVALDNAFFSAEYCTKENPDSRVLHERGDRNGYYRGCRSNIRLPMGMSGSRATSYRNQIRSGR